MMELGEVLLSVGLASGENAWEAGVEGVDANAGAAEEGGDE